MDLELKNKVALVTGGGRGVGRGICLRLAAEGAKVVVNDLHDRRAERVAGEIKEAGGTALAIAANICDLAQVRAMVAKATETLGPVTRAPVARSVTMIVVGAIAAIWAIATLTS